MCENDVSLFHNLSPVNPGIFILEYTAVIREEKNPLMVKMFDSVFF